MLGSARKNVAMALRVVDGGAMETTIAMVVWIGGDWQMVSLVWVPWFVKLSSYIWIKP